MINFIDENGYSDFVSMISEGFDTGLPEKMKIGKGHVETFIVQMVSEDWTDRTQGFAVVEIQDKKDGLCGTIRKLWINDGEFGDNADEYAMALIVNTVNAIREHGAEFISATADDASVDYFVNSGFDIKNKGRKGADGKRIGIQLAF